jgi:hypothetical protein
LVGVVAPLHAVQWWNVEERIQRNMGTLEGNKQKEMTPRWAEILTVKHDWFFSKNTEFCAWRRKTQPGGTWTYRDTNIFVSTVLGV